ncbi:hypothetical protein [Streptomyces sp. HNM0574]|nr:hypothetical protein [Streptomyces sp. HNM0574]NLU67088.1 hypothetical protein [Streptomyces sp. HNM0574]
MSGSRLSPARERRTPLIVLTWTWVGVPLAWGAWELVRKAAQLFTG